MREARTNESAKSEAPSADRRRCLLPSGHPVFLRGDAADLVDLPVEPDVERGAVQMAALVLPAAVAVLELREHAAILQILDVSEEHDAHHRAVLCHGEQLLVHGVAQRLVAEIEADGVLLHGDGLREDNVVALGVGDLVVADTDVHDNGVHRTLPQLQETGVVVGQLHELTEGGGQLLVRGESVQTGGSGLHHNGFSGEIGEGLDAGVGADNGDDAVIDVGVRPGVLFLAAGAGEAVPDAVDVSGFELGVLRRPVDRHGLIFPAEPRADLLREREIKAVVAAVLGNVAPNPR